MQRVMMQVSRRGMTGSSAMRRLRRQGSVPGVVYGRGLVPMNIQVSAQDLLRALHARGGEHAVLTLQVGDGARHEETTAIIKHVQHDAVTDAPIHVDFQHILMTEKIKVTTPIEASGEAVGVKRDQGVLEHQLWELEIECLPTDIPEKISVNVEALAIGDAIHVRDLTVPNGIEVLSDVDAVVFAVAPPRMEEPTEAVVAEEGAEPEVIAKGKEEAEAGEAGEAGEEESSSASTA